MLPRTIRVSRRRVTMLKHAVRYARYSATALTAAVFSLSVG